MVPKKITAIAGDADNGKMGDENADKGEFLSRFSGQGIHLSVFDLDNTLIRGNTSFKFCKYLFEKKIYPLSALCYAVWMYVQHDWLSRVSLNELHQRVFRKMLFGRSLELFSQNLNNFIESSFLNLVYQPAFNALRLAQHLGHHTMILSNSPNFLVEAVSRFLQVDEWGASQYGLDKDKRLSNITFLMQGEDKAKVIQRKIQELGIKKEDVTAYSDSHLDLPFLLAAGNPIAVNPDKKLRHFAKQHHWSII